VFLLLGKPLRNNYRCVRCWSEPRRRALTVVLDERVPRWRESRVHEFGPARAAVTWFEERCSRYTYSHFWPDVPPGTERDGVRCEDLMHLTFGDGELDLVISQDVFEHLPDPAAAAAEVARVLAPGGAHVFTVPVYPRPTVIRAELDDGGGVHHVLEPDYHGNPADDRRSLVFREWGPDVVDFIERASGLDTEMIAVHDRRRGLDGGWLDVLVSTKATDARLSAPGGTVSS
jgi:SAM-dependent methyltransferase